MSTSDDQRPLSPHLQVYRLPLTAITSISHRITGVALWVGSLLLVGWLWAVAYDGEYYNCWQELASHTLGKIALIGWTFALFYHMANGVRHIFWDAGLGFDKDTATKNGLLVIFVAFAMTAALWGGLMQEIELF